MQIGHQDIARRYAQAFFELADEQGQIDRAATDFQALAGMLSDSADFNRFIADVTLPRAAQAKAASALAAKVGLCDLTRKLLGTLAMKRRLALLPVVVAEVRARLDARQGIVSADVTSAGPLDKAQADALTTALKTALGTQVRLHVTENADIIGGLVVQVGSLQIDSSVRTKLQRLHRTIRNSYSSETNETKEVA